MVRLISRRSVIGADSVLGVLANETRHADDFLILFGAECNIFISLQDDLCMYARRMAGSSSTWESAEC